MYDAKINSVCISCPLSIINIAHNRETNTYTVGSKHPENNISFSFWKRIICSGFTPNRKQFWNKEPGFAPVSTWLSRTSCCSNLVTGTGKGTVQQWIKPCVCIHRVNMGEMCIWGQELESETKQLTLFSCPSVINTDQRGPETIDFTRKTAE